ncbi:toll/interleukin-1 receptor domain-containing protein [Streptomyces sp. NPDC045470]|uniref:toll/interleukin-1 receptor domain-containing protein n=1 Tax=unclassified Streptomyces TaxID=2593676 RepID=UPI0033DDAD92
MTQRPEIFINYRTADAPDGAALIENHLSQRFGTELVFRDGKSIPAGSLFPEALRSAVRNCSVLLAVIGPRWLDSLRGQAADGGDDWTCREIAEALESGAQVIPVLIGPDTAPPAADRLPVGIRELTRRQYRRVTSYTSHDDLDLLADELARLVPRLGEADSRAARDGDGEARTRNTVDGNHGTVFQAGTIGTALNKPSGAVHSGQGNQYVNSHQGDQYTHSNHQSGGSGVHFTGGNQGGISFNATPPQDESEGR